MKFRELLTRDTLLAVSFVFPAIIAIAHVWVGEWSATFWISSLITAISLALSRHKLALVIAAVAYITIPAVGAAVFKRDREAAVLALIGGPILVGLVILALRLERAPLRALVSNKACPRCGAVVRESRCAAASRDGDQEKSIGWINRCPCGEWTLYEHSGGVRHVDKSPPPEVHG